MQNSKFLVHWNISGDRDTLMLAHYKWYRFEIGWPVYDKDVDQFMHPLKVYYKDVLDCECSFGSLHAAVVWVMQSCNDFALADDTDWKRC